MSEGQTIANNDYKEWTFGEDAAGIVYCLGRKVTEGTHEAVAVYERMPHDEGTKLSLDCDATYNRIMYHGFPEEDGKLLALRPEIQASILGNMSLRDYCIFLDPSDIRFADSKYRSIDVWLSDSGKRTAAFREALEKACTIAHSAGISLTGAQLYGGAAFGLVGSPDKRVDDVDLLLDISSEELYQGAQTFRSSYKWDEIDPQSILSDRRKLLKAKRWSTSQIRLFTPAFLSIDLKINRNSDKQSLWNDLPTHVDLCRFEGPLEVIDDSEAYCISPAIRCEDKQGNERTVLFRGYPYIGCAVAGDIITIRGSAVKNSSVVLVTQAPEDLMIPDFSNVPIS